MTTVMIEPAAVAPVKERRTRFDSKALLAAPGLVFMTFAFAVPVVLLVAESFTRPARPHARRLSQGARRSLLRRHHLELDQARADHHVRDADHRLSGGLRARAREGHPAGRAVRADFPAADGEHHRQDVRHLDHDGAWRHHQLAAGQPRLHRAADPARVHRVQSLFRHGQRLSAVHDPAALFRRCACSITRLTDAAASLGAGPVYTFYPRDACR